MNKGKIPLLWFENRDKNHLYRETELAVMESVTARPLIQCGHNRRSSLTTQTLRGEIGKDAIVKLQSLGKSPFFAIALVHFSNFLIITNFFILQ